MSVKADCKNVAQLQGLLN